MIVRELPKLPLANPITLNWRQFTKTRYLVIGKDVKRKALQSSWLSFMLEKAFRELARFTSAMPT